MSLSFRTLQQEINQLVKKEDQHLNEFYRTKQKMKMEADAEGQRRREILDSKENFKKELDKDL